MKKTSEQCSVISDYLPSHIAKELQSSHMSMIAHASLSDAQQLPADKKITVTLDRSTPTEVHVRCFSATEYPPYEHSLLMCNTINEIFEGESTSDDDAVRIFLQAMVMIFGKGVLTSMRADMILEAASLKLILHEMDHEDPRVVRELAEDPETVRCINRVGLKNVSNPKVLMLAYCGAVLLLAGKHLTEASAEAWTQKRVRGLAASMGSAVETTGVAGFNVKAAVRVYQKLSMLVPLRERMVRTLFGTTGTGTIIPSLAAAMLTLLAWAEMNHIRMIQEYIFGRYPELLAMKQLQGSSLGILSTAWDYLRTLDEWERPYAKLLYGPTKTMALRRDQFTLLIDAAHAVGAYLHTSFSNYKGDTPGTAGSAVRKIVTEYLMSLERTGQKFVQAAQLSTMNQQMVDNIPKANRLFNSQLEEMEKEVEALMRS